MFSMPWLGGKPHKPPLMTKKFQNQNNLAYRASEKSRLGKVEEVGSFDINVLTKSFLIDLFDWGASATCNFNRDFVSEKCCQRWDLRTFWLNIVCHRVSASLWLLNVSLITHLKLMVTNLSEILACCIHWQHFPKELELTESVNALYEYCLAYKLPQRSQHNCSQFL